MKLRNAEGVRCCLSEKTEVGVVSATTNVVCAELTVLRPFQDPQKGPYGSTPHTLTNMFGA